MFESRAHAAALLAERLQHYRGRNPVVLGIPRGAVPMARVVADALEAELDVVLVHKLGAPDNPEYAIGSISEHGELYLTPAARELGISESYIAREAREQLERLRRRRTEYTPVRPPIDPAGRITIVVDNGVATGATMIAALRAVRARRPARLVAAMAVAPHDTVARIAREADEVVCLEIPEVFYAVGQFFQDFSQVTDEDVMRALSTMPGARSTNH
jgi:predicted phosphoribosyltransferase